MDKIKKQVEDAFSQIDWKVEIDTKWMGKEIKETIILPDYLQVGLRDKIEQYITDKRSVSEKIYIGQIGSTQLTGAKLIKEVEKIANISGVKTEDLKISHNEENALYIKYKLPYSDIKLDVLAKGEYDRVVYQYKQDYNTMLRIQNTKRIANV